ncbi:MAG: nucleoside deaminase [Gammaproteobacteria bacterium]|nr:nucleoside deaminase [Gammaproteobacteria bacterium]
MKTDDAQSLMRQAIRLSLEKMDQGQGGPFGAVIALEGRIISEGYNQVTSQNDPTAHAEIVAIRRACETLNTFSLAGCDIYTSCEPCPMCLSAIYWARIDQIYYANTRQDAAMIGFDDEFLYREVSIPLEHRQIPTIRLLEHEAMAAFEAWTNKPDKIRY